MVAIKLAIPSGSVVRSMHGISKCGPKTRVRSVSFVEHIVCISSLLGRDALLRD